MNALTPREVAMVAMREHAVRRHTAPMSPEAWFLVDVQGSVEGPFYHQVPSILL